MSLPSVLIEFKNLAIRYGTEVAIEDLDLSVEAGAVYALIGRNGAGKSSLVRCLLGLQKPTRGEAWLFGENAWKRRAHLLDRVGFVAEEPDAPPEATAKEILAFCARIYPKWNEHGAIERLRAFDVPMSTPHARLSKGQKRQVALAIALASEPELLVLDDPTLGLDVVARKELFEELVADLADRGTTVFITTHDLAGIESIASRVGILRNGRLILDEEIESLKWRFRRIRYATREVSPHAPALEQFRPIGMRQWGSGTEAVVTSYEELELERFRNAPGVREVEVIPMSLEEIFIAMSNDQGVESKGAES